TLTVAMNQAVTVATGGGNPTLTLNTGGTATYDAAASNPGSGLLVFDYTVGAGEHTTQLSVTQVNLPTGTTVTDGTGHTADFSHASDIAFSGGAPQIGALSVGAVTPSQTGGAHTGQTVSLSLQFAAGVTVNAAGGA